MTNDEGILPSTSPPHRLPAIFVGATPTTRSLFFAIPALQTRMLSSRVLSPYPALSVSLAGGLPEAYCGTLQQL